MSTEKDKGMFSKENEIAGLWQRETANGKKFLSGKLDLTKFNGEDVGEVTIWPNTFKDKNDPDDRSPNYRVYKSLPWDGNKGSGAAAAAERAVKTTKAATKAKKVEVEEQDGEEEPPF